MELPWHMAIRGERKCVPICGQKGEGSACCQGDGVEGLGLGEDFVAAAPGFACFAESFGTKGRILASCAQSLTLFPFL